MYFRLALVLSFICVTEYKCYLLNETLPFGLDFFFDDYTLTTRTPSLLVTPQSNEVTQLSNTSALENANATAIDKGNAEVFADSKGQETSAFIETAIRNDSHPLNSMPVVSTNDTSSTVVNSTSEYVNSPTTIIGAVVTPQLNDNVILSTSSPIPGITELISSALLPTTNETNVQVSVDNKEPETTAPPEMTITTVNGTQVISTNETSPTVVASIFDSANSTNTTTTGPIITIEPDYNTTMSTNATIHETEETTVSTTMSTNATIHETEETTVSTPSPKLNETKVLVFMDGKKSAKPMLVEATISTGELMGMLTNDRYVGAVVGGILSLFIVIGLISVCFYLRQRAKRSEKWANVQAKKENTSEPEWCTAVSQI